MMRSLYSGVAGLKTHQTRMDVIGNNIANVNTTAYKSQSMTFSDLMYQTTQAASGANPVTGAGGVNARQIGLGAKTSAIKTAITSQGASQTTNDPFDLMITGENFFIVKKGNENFFTRDGSFYVDGVGNLCMTSTGYKVQGWLAVEDPTTGKIEIKKDTVKDLKVMSAENMTYPPEVTSKAELSGIVDAKDPDVTGDGRLVTLDFYDQLGYKYTSRFMLQNVKDAAGNVIDGQYQMKITSITDSTGEELITTTDPTDPTKTIPDTTAYEAAFNPTQNYLFFNTTTGVLEHIGDTAPTATTAKTTDFLIQLPALQRNGAPIATFSSNITVDASSVVNFNNNGGSTVTCTRGDKDGDGSGRMLGEMSGISISKDGRINATYDNGQSKLIGQIATAAFANASGLAKEGDNLYSATENSGAFDGIGVDISAGGGYMNSGVLEMSNVDLSAEFTEMITTQRGFQANSRIITVSDTLLEELTNLKR